MKSFPILAVTLYIKKKKNDDSDRKWTNLFIVN